MDIDRMKKEGKCFCCGKKGHMKHDCLPENEPLNKTWEQIRALCAQLDMEEKALPKEEKLADMTKVEEVKDMATN